MRGTGPEPSARLHGRDRELEALRAVLRGAARGRLHIALLEGEAGIGKSRLLDEVVDEAHQDGFAVRAGRAEELESTRPFGAFVSALGSEATTVLTGPLGSATAPVDPGARFRVVDAITDRLEADATPGPLLLALDDLQWADESTLMAVAAVIRRLEQHPVAVVLAFRLSPRGEPLERVIDMLTRADATLLSVPPLEAASVDELLADLLAARPSVRLRQLAVGAGGNPLFVHELVAVVAGQSEHAEATAAESAYPLSLRVTILRRLGYLSREALEVLRLAAVLGPSFTAAELAAVTGREPAGLLAVLDEPLRAGVLEVEGSAFRFRHDLIREAVYGDVAEPIRRALHVEVARALAASGARSAIVARHYALGADDAHGEAVAWLRRGAEELAPIGPQAAIGLLSRALELVDERDPVAHEVLTEQAELLAYAGSPEAAEAAARQLLRSSAEPNLVGRARSALGHALFVRGRWADVVDETKTTAENEALDDALRARTLAECALARIWTGDLDGAESSGQAALELGRRADDPVAVAFALGHLSVAADLRGDMGRSLALAREGLDVALTSGLPEAERRHPHIAVGMALYTSGQLRAAVTALREGRQLGARAGTVWDIPLYSTMVALPLLALGEWDNAVTEAESALALTEEVGTAVADVTARAILATVALHRGALDQAADHIGAATAIVEASGPQWGMYWLTNAILRLEIARGDPGAGLERAVAVWDGAASTGDRAAHHWVARDLVDAAERSGDRVRAECAARAAEEYAGIARTEVGRAVADMCAGRVAADPSRLLAAADRFDEVKRPLDAASAREWTADMLVGRNEDAARLYREAAQTYVDLGADHDLRRVTTAMRAAGLRGPRSPRTRATFGWEALTPAEIEVVRLAAQGLTNPQIGEQLFVSRRTVQTHLSHVFAKLGISSRVQLAAEAAARSL